MAIEHEPQLDTHLEVFTDEQLEALARHAESNGRVAECRRLGAEMLKRVTEIVDPNEA